MKISVFSIPEIKLGKQSVKDSRLDEVDKITKAKKKTYVQVELAGEDGLLDSDAVLTLNSSKADLILRDLEFTETRISRTTDQAEKQLLEKIKQALEKEQFVFQAQLQDAEKQAVVKYGLCTARPVIAVEKQELEDLNTILARCLKEAGFISFFTTGEKETRAWLIRKGSTAWDASGAIHSDIQKGFIRAEIISYEDFIQSGGETAAKQAGKLRLEQKEYLMRDADLANFRFNK